MSFSKKNPLNQLKKDMSVFLDIPNVEASLKKEIEEFVKTISLSKPRNGSRLPIDVLTDYLKNPNQDEKLKIILALSNGSKESLKRVFQAIFPQRSFAEWKNKEDFRMRMISFLLNPSNEKAFVPSFIKNNFYLPKNWMDLLSDQKVLMALTQNSYQSKYAVKMGDALEKNIVKIVKEIGIQYQKGPVEIVDNKEVDIAIPNTRDPSILIMSSYSLTTSSAQSSKANEQARMYQDIQTYNRRKRQRNKSKILFINVIDGGGWLARSSDLERMWEECDYCFCHSNMKEGLKYILRFYKESIA